MGGRGRAIGCVDDWYASKTWLGAQEAIQVPLGPALGPWHATRKVGFGALAVPALKARERLTPGAESEAHAQGRARAPPGEERGGARGRPRPARRTCRGRSPGPAGRGMRGCGGRVCRGLFAWAQAVIYNSSPASSELLMSSSDFNLSLLCLKMGF